MTNMRICLEKNPKDKCRLHRSEKGVVVQVLFLRRGNLESGIPDEWRWFETEFYIHGLRLEAGQEASEQRNGYGDWRCQASFKECRIKVREAYAFLESQEKEKIQ